MSETLETPDVIAEALAAIKVPKWAVEVDEWASDGLVAHREVRGRAHDVHPCTIPEGEPFQAVVRLAAFQVSDGRPEGACVQLDFGPGLPAEMTSESARSLAQALIEVADEMDGPTPVGRYVGEFLAQIVRNIRGHMARLDMHQDQLAISAGYGMDEMSALMTGRRIPDVVDIFRIGRALNIDPLELITEPGEQ